MQNSPLSSFLDSLSQRLSFKNIITFALKVTPNAKKSEFIDIISLSDSPVLKIKIKAKPQKNQANQALQKFLSQYFKVPKSRVTILSGHTSSHKLIQIRKEI